MKDPTRLLDGSASELEQRLLRAGAAEQPPEAAMQRLADQLGVTAPASVRSEPSALTSAKLPLAAASKTGLVAAGFVGLGITLAAVGWVATRNAPAISGPSPDQGREPAAATTPRHAAESSASEPAPSTDAHAAEPHTRAPHARSALQPTAASPSGTSPSLSSETRQAPTASAVTKAHNTTSVPSAAGLQGTADGAAATSPHGASPRPSSRPAGSNLAVASPRSGTSAQRRVAADDDGVAAQRRTKPAAETARVSESAATRDALQSPPASVREQPLLAHEIARIDAVRRQLAAHRPKSALAALQAYRRDFPGGVLRQEAELLTIEALGQAGDRDRARMLGARFLASNPDSPHSARVRDLLEALGPDAR